MIVTLGSLLQRLECSEEDQKFAFFMPKATGPCRFGVYNLLHGIVLERQGWDDRVRIWSPDSADYFKGLPRGFSALVFVGFAAADMLHEALLDARPTEVTPGLATATYTRYRRELMAILENAARGDLGPGQALLQVANGRLFGVADLLGRAARNFAEIKGEKDLPTALVVGEIYVRLDPFSNDHLVRRLEERGIKVRFAPFTEWLEYTDHLAIDAGRKSGFRARLSSFMQGRIQARCYSLMAGPLAWPHRTTVKDTIAAGRDYLRDELWGEAILTIGGPVHEWREGLIDGVVSVAPLECMPAKIGEAQLFHAAEREGLVSLNLSVNGDPLDPEILDDFAFELRTRFERGRKDRDGSRAG